MELKNIDSSKITDYKVNDRTILLIEDHKVKYSITCTIELTKFLNKLKVTENKSDILKWLLKMIHGYTSPYKIVSTIENLIKVEDKDEYGLKSVMIFNLFEDLACGGNKSLIRGILCCPCFGLLHCLNGNYGMNKAHYFGGPVLFKLKLNFTEFKRKFNVFISHPGAHKSIAHKIEGELNINGLTTFIDESNIDLGITNGEALLEAIKNSDVILCLVSRGFIESKWCNWEFESAVQEKKRIIPIFMEDSLPNHPIKSFSGLILEKYNSEIGNVVKQLLSMLQ